MEIGDAPQTAAGRSTIARDALIGLGIAAALVVECASGSGVRVYQPPTEKMDS